MRVIQGSGLGLVWACEAVCHKSLNSDCVHCSQQCKAVVNQCEGHSGVWDRSGLVISGTKEAHKRY